MALTAELSDRVTRAMRERIYFNQVNRNAWVGEIASRLSAGTRVLDVGAGECRYRHLFSHCDYRTQDHCQYEGTSAGPAQDSWQYGQIDYVSDVIDIPVDDESFDAILCTEVLEHVLHPIAAIDEFARIVRPDGHVFISAPLGSGLHQEPHHYYGGFTPHFYRQVLPEAGLTVRRILPDGGFFRHLSQELSRASTILDERRGRSRRDPRSLARALVTKVLGPLWLSSLDDRVFVEEFTVGYFVEAQKSAPAQG